MIRTEQQNGIYVVTADNPPVNALSNGVREGLAKAIADAGADPAVRAIVVACAGRTFFAGADIAEFTKGMQPPLPPDLCDMIEASEKPVVAAIHGTALGGGLEVALACHYRIAVPSAKLGQPEVKLGLLPGAGGTQRLPRVAGAELALKMIVLGDPIGAREAAEAGLVDRLAGEDRLLADAIAFAREIADARPLPRAGGRTASADPALFDTFRAANAKKLRGYDAPEACIEAVRAATTMPFREGLALERQLFLKLVMGEQSAALRHIFFAERTAGKIDGLPEGTTPLPVRKVGIVGAGTMGGGIAMNFLSAGVPVTIVEMKQEALDRGVATIRRNYEGNVARGRLTAEGLEKAMALLTPTLSYDDLADADLIIEAVFEDIGVKKDVFKKLDAVAKPGAILASNTSFLDVNEIAAVTARADHVLGLHFFSPANVMKLLEIVRGAKTAPAVLATAMAAAKAIRKVAVIAGVCHGFIGNRMLEQRQIEAVKLLMEGVTPQQIDKAHVDFGMPMGPFQMADLAGIDIGWHRDPQRIESITDALCAAGRLGQKAGKGFYDYDDQRRATPSAEAQAIIDDFAARSGAAKRAVGSEEILERTLYPMVNEGAKILDEGIAQRASDIDIVWIYGYGWPPYRGGPMFWADRVGLTKIVESLKKHGQPVAPALEAKAAKGERFNR